MSDLSEDEYMEAGKQGWRNTPGLYAAGGRPPSDCPSDDEEGDDDDDDDMDVPSRSKPDLDANPVPMFSSLFGGDSDEDEDDEAGAVSAEALAAVDPFAPSPPSRASSRTSDKKKKKKTKRKLDETTMAAAATATTTTTITTDTAPNSNMNDALSAADQLYPFPPGVAHAARELSRELGLPLPDNLHIAEGPSPVAAATSIGQAKKRAKIEQIRILPKPPPGGAVPAKPPLPKAAQLKQHQRRRRSSLSTTGSSNNKQQPRGASLLIHIEHERQQQQQSLERVAQETQKQVSQAASCVAQALYTGPWPSPIAADYLDQEDEDKSNKHDGGQGTTTASSSTTPKKPSFQDHQAHMSMVGASLQQLGHDIILPAILQAQLQPSSQDAAETSASSSPTKQPSRRPLLGTLLLLREVLMMNAHTIFGRRAILWAKRNNSKQGKKQADAGQENKSRHKQQQEEKEEMECLERMPWNILLTDPTVRFVVRVMSTSIILQALQIHLEEEGIGDPDSTKAVVTRFLALAESYDQGSVDFLDVFAQLQESKTTIRPVLPRTGEVVEPAQHASAWQTSFQGHLQRHPSCSAKRQRPTMSNHSGNESIPRAHAVHVTILRSSASTTS